MDLSRDTVVTRTNGQVSSDLGGEVVIFDVDAGTYFGLEGVGARVWELLGQSVTMGEIERILLEEYDVEPERCWRDLVHLLSGLIERGLVEVPD
ncbi:MAG TPA: PqqD family peptide modification chaperone [Gemmatimonadota bacterium]|nr:PqqD family peptide modification chaperone [Gemmatimonadota bacterium]